MTFGQRQTWKKKSLRNLATLCVLLVVALALYHDPFLILWWHERPVQWRSSETGVFPLDMAASSVDDMYDGCRAKAAAVTDVFGVFEWHVNRNFSHAWASAERGAKKPVHESLTGEHATVLYMHTEPEGIRQEFNRAVSVGKPRYGTYGFKFHYLYFHLTDAVQVLRRNQTSCRTAYHRTRTYFKRSVVGREMRFGAFTLAASSKRSFEFLGNVSCFEVYTCSGADVTYYSAADQEGQVLIPPYEVFKITAILTSNAWCEVVYALRSTNAPRSDLNCQKFKAVERNWSQINFVITSTGVILLVLSSVVLIKRKQERFVAVVLSALLVLMVTVVMWRWCV
ncbi:ecto-ADP-ribosyltransferase 4-like [Diretmus argenteus]